ncbi:MAG: mandelate racemase/muconate lactonizing enzyme family protein [Candidatus Bathyarchaeia archaeon]
MEITEVKTTLVTIPVREPIRVSMGLEGRVSAIVVEVETDAGITGVGETRYSERTDAMIHNEIKHLVVGTDPFDVERTVKHYLGSGRGLWWLNAASYAITGVEMACWDIIGKSLRTPIYRLMGGRFREKVPITAFLGIDRPEKVVKEAVTAVEQGVKTLKLKVGRDADEDVEIVRQVREAVGDDIQIRVDPNQAWSPPTAIRQIRKISRFDPQYIEQPIPRWDLKGLAHVRRKVSVPIAICEGVLSPYRAMEVITHRAADFISTDPARLGGLLWFKKVSAMAEAADIPVILHVSNCGVSVAAWLHLATSTPNVMYANDIPPVGADFGRSAVDDIIMTPFKHEEGYLKAPEGPGLGVAIDRDRLRKYADLYRKTPKKKPEMYFPPAY